MNLCRLCEGNIHHKFNLKVLDKFDVDYFQCSCCDSLLTEEPYWLELAYDNNITSTDVGIVQRNIENFVNVYFLAKILNIKNIVDFGGGDGLLCRMLRDYGLNCYLEDKFSSPTYAQKFTSPDFITPDLICGFEVVEHLISPLYDLKNLFQKKVKFLIFSTVIYDNQSQDWWYLSAHTGQHIFFYSKKALYYIGRRFNYKVNIFSNYVIFSLNDLSFINRIFIKILFNPLISRILKIIVMMKRPYGIVIDYNKLNIK